MKRFLTAVMAVALLVTVFSGCLIAADGQVTINVMSSDDFAGFRGAVIADFEKAYPNIKVNFMSVGYDALHQKEITALASGSDAYDVIDVDCIWTPEYVTNGYIVQVDDRMTEEQRKGIVPVAMDILTYEGKQYGLPMFNDVLYLYYNKELLEQAGVKEFPKTWDDFTEVCRMMQEKKLVDYGSAWGWAQAEGLICYYLGFVKAFGGAMVDEGTHMPDVNNPGSVAALSYMTDSLHKTNISDPASVTSDDRNAIEMFSHGRLPFCVDWSFAWSVFNDPDQSNVVGKVGVALLPGMGSVRSATCAGSMGLSITSDSKYKDEAWKFIEFLASREIQKRQSIEAGALPIWTDLYGDPDLIASNPAMPAMAEQLEYAHNRPMLTWYNEFSHNLQVEIQNALTQNKTPQQALDDAQKTLLDIAKQY